MKKLFIMLFALLCGFVELKAVNIYLNPGAFNQDGARYALYANNGSEVWVNFVYDDKSTYYKAALPENSTLFILVRMNGSTTENNWSNKWNQTGDITDIPQWDAYYSINSLNGDKCGYTGSLLPWNCYLISNKSGSWAVETEMAETSQNVFSCTFDGADYAEKLIAWVTGDGVGTNNTIYDWNKVYRPDNSDKSAGNGDHFIVFANFNYDAVYNNLVGDGKKVWYLPHTGTDDQVTNEGDVTITFNKTAMSATITCSKTAHIGASGYTTYSNSENYIVDGATAYTASSKVGDYVYLTAQNSDIIYPGGETGGILLGGTPNTDVTINAAAYGASATLSGTNYFKGNGNYSSTPSIGENIYILWWDGSDTSSLGFYKAKAESGHHTLAAHRAYLDLTGAGGSSREFLGFSFSEPTSVKGIETLDFNKNVAYNLAGQRVVNMTKGLYILNGKKYFVK